MAKDTHTATTAVARSKVSKFDFGDPRLVIPVTISTEADVEFARMDITVNQATGEVTGIKYGDTGDLLGYTLSVPAPLAKLFASGDGTEAGFAKAVKDWLVANGGVPA